jgi:hypothetical protein
MCMLMIRFETFTFTAFNKESLLYICVHSIRFLRVEPAFGSLPNPYCTITRSVEIFQVAAYDIEIEVQ